MTDELARLLHGLERAVEAPHQHPAAAQAVGVFGGVGDQDAAGPEALAQAGEQLLEALLVLRRQVLPRLEGHGEVAALDEGPGVGARGGAQARPYRDVVLRQERLRLRGPVDPLLLEPL